MLAVPNLGVEKEIAAIYFAKIIKPQLTKKIMLENSFFLTFSSENLVAFVTSSLICAL